MAAGRRAAASLALFQTPYLDALVAGLAEQIERSYRAALDNRRKLRALFQA